MWKLIGELYPWVSLESWYFGYTSHRVGVFCDINISSTWLFNWYLVHPADWGHFGISSQLPTIIPKLEVYYHWRYWITPAADQRSWLCIVSMWLADPFAWWWWYCPCLHTYPKHLPNYWHFCNCNIISSSQSRDYLCNHSNPIFLLNFLNNSHFQTGPFH